MSATFTDEKPVLPTLSDPSLRPRFRRPAVYLLCYAFGGALMIGCGSDSNDPDASANTAERKTPQSAFTLNIAQSTSVNGEAVFSVYEPVPSAQQDGAQQNGFSMTGVNGDDFITLSLYQADPFPVQRQIELANPAVSDEGSFLNAFFSQKEWASKSGNVLITVLDQNQVSGVFESTLFNIDNEQETLAVTGEFSGLWKLDCWVKIGNDTPTNDNTPPGGTIQVWEPDADTSSDFCQIVSSQM